MSDRVLLRPDEAAQRLGLSRAMVFRLLKDGTLRSVRIGRARRVPVAALDDFAAALTECPDEAATRRR